MVETVVKFLVIALLIALAVNAIASVAFVSSNLIAGFDDGELFENNYQDGGPSVPITGTPVSLTLAAADIAMPGGWALWLQAFNVMASAYLFWLVFGWTRKILGV